MPNPWDEDITLAPAAPPPAESVAGAGSNPWDSDVSAAGKTRQRAVIGADSVPDEAARALAIAKKTQIPAQVVQGDLPAYDNHAKQQSAIRASENPSLAKYIDGNPMAATVSADDYEKLDEVGQTLYALHPELLRSKASGGLFKAVPEIAAMAQTEAGVQKLTNALIGLPYGLGKGLYDYGKSLVTMPGRAYTEGFGKPGDIDEAIGIGIGIALGAGGPKGAIKTGKPAPTEGTPAGYVSFDDFMHQMEGMKTRKEIDEFLQSKAGGPPGAMLQIEYAKAGAESLDKAVEVAQGSKTKERSPELFAEAAQAHDPGNIHIDSQKIIDLYNAEGKVPAEGDGLLGFIPGLPAKLRAAAAGGHEITVPVAQYLAHIDEAVHEKLRESVRLHDDGVTLEETKEIEKEIEAWHGTPHDFERFDLTKIGTGEGAQIYGHGLYFAENQKVAAGYADKLAPAKIKGEPLDENRPDHMLVELLHLTYAGDRTKLISVLKSDVLMLEESNLSGDKKNLEKYKKALAIAESNAEIPNFDENTGNLVKVSINADPTKFLDWDKPLKEQSQHVQDVIRKLNKGEDLESNLNVGDAIKRGHYPGTFDINSPEFAKLYSEAGIPGIKYLDQGSRGAGEGTRNFVVFDDKLVTIKEKNGNAVEALVEGAVENAKQLLYLNQLFKDAKSVGITDAEFKRYSDKIQKSEEHILDKAIEIRKREIAKPLTAEWKRNEAAVKTEVTKEFDEQGVFAAEEYLRKNKIELGGDRIDEIADGLASLWGFESGADLRQALTDLETVQAADRKSVLVQKREAIDAETARRMEEKYGNLAENIAAEAREIALSLHAFDIMADEVAILAKAAGIEPPLARQELLDLASRTFEQASLADAANWQKQQRAVTKGGRDAEKALLKGDFLEAFQAKQRQMIAAALARHSLALQKVIDGAERKIDRFTSEQTIKDIEQEHLNQIRSMLASIGVPQQFPPGLDTIPLRDFVAEAEGQLAVAPWLMDRNPTKLSDMSVAEFRDFFDSMKSLENGGRQAQKLENAQGEAELQNVVLDAVKSMERFPFKHQPQNPSIAQKLASYGRMINGAHLLVERVLDYTDKFDPHGPLTEWLDRPLRDANTKEINLTEEVVRGLKDLQQYVDKSINDTIQNKLIPDANDRTGFLQMTRQNLRVLMLNMGNWSNLGKLNEGFNVNEADLRRFVAQNATAKDVAWVNGVWDIFKKLKPEADAVHLKDTGVPVDTVEAVGWDVPAGKLEGGYFPLIYDKYNSDIQARIRAPLFDKGYIAATTPHRYTQERTGYVGAIDLSGDFLATKLRGMVHDIAFRLPVRNADKLIRNQEFMTAVGQYWGNEVRDLLPGWIRDIANSHNFDDAYATELTRISAQIRQNVVSTLIAYNPSTFIKHGFTAAVMSADRVGLLNILDAFAQIGLKGIGGHTASAVPNSSFLSRFVKASDRMPDEAFMDSFRDTIDRGERGENARQFILDSSAVMRNRQRQYDESIYGATQAITEIGVMPTLAQFRQRQIQYGRMAVAIGDQMSAMPTWLAAYKKAYASGENHADAVFIADKEMSRAHGSNFIGDQPRVTRAANTAAGEFTRWFTQLYKFYNHFQNNLFQMAWDAEAWVREKFGAEGGNANEPGATAASISRRNAYLVSIIMIEEMAGPAKDEHGHGPLARAMLAMVRLLGAGFVGVREITNGLAHGYEPSTGMIGTLWHGLRDSAKDLGKASGVKAGIAKDWIRNTATAIGFMTGVGGSQQGRTGQFMYDVAKGKDRPQTFNDYRQGLRTGHSKARKLP